MAERVLYWGSGSVPAWRALITLKAKGLDFTSKMVEFSKQEHKGDDIMAINARGQVPTFRDGDIVVNESLAIMQYLEAKYPEPALMPKDDKEYALALQRFHECNSLYSAVQPLFYVRMTQPDYDKARFNEGIEKARKELKIWDGYLASDPKYIAGSTMTLADLSLALLLFFGQRGGMTFGEFPHLKKYLEAMKQNPLVQETWPPHWANTDNKDWLTAL